MLCCAKQNWIAVEAPGGGSGALRAVALQEGEQGSVKGTPRMSAIRPAILGEPSRMEVFAIKNADASSKRYEHLNLFAGTSV